MKGDDSEHSNYMDLTTDSENYKKLDRPPKNLGMKDNLRSILELPTKYQCVFEFPFFNIIQSHILEDVLYSDSPFVISSPTGSGKTVVFELAIIRLLMNFEETNFIGDFKIIYVAPVKALCSERLTDWHRKFSKIGLSCIVITGDSDNVTYKMLQRYQIIITTPEKWDSLTRNAQDNPIVQDVKLFMIDEVHLLNEETRGPILEAIVSRMKVFRKNNPVRFIAVSATIPNIEDIADWLGNSGESAIYFKIGEELRPVKLKKIVLGYSCQPGTTAFKFDINLNYKLRPIIMQYSEGKPTLIFCSTRKGVELTAKHISQDITFHLTAEQKTILKNCAQKLLDNKMKSQLINGVGSHHAGMTADNRILIEEVFRAGHLPVLATTSTLAMGVNLPAHLVIIKSTERYVQGEVQNYSESNLLQMIGRAGRPQFDTHATVVIMTKAWEKEHYEKFLGGTELIESNLHRHLTQHLNAEVVLGVITDIAIALDWIRHTYLYVRALKNPKYYNIGADTKDKIEKRLQDICQIEINALHRYGMLQIDQLDGFSVSPTNTGNLMATYYLHLDTMKLFAEVNGQETLAETLTIITKCKEFSETLLRNNDKKTLNTLNKCKFQSTIRFPLPGTIKTTEMKINCIIQANLGCLKIQNPSLLQESVKIMKTGKSITKCLVEYLCNKGKCFSALHNALILNQCFHTTLWENSPNVSRQLPKIGPVLSSMLATAGKTTFKTILEANPRDLELIINRAPPMGNEIHDLVLSLPFYSIELTPPETNTTFNVKLVLTLLNADSVKINCNLDIGTFMTLLVGDSENNILANKKIFHKSMLVCKEYVQYIDIVVQNNHIITAYLISQNWVGIDTKKTVEIKISNSITSNSKNHSSNITQTPAKTIENNPEIKTPNSSAITSYFKQVKNLPPNITNNEKKSASGSKVKKNFAGVNKNGMKSITTYFSKPKEPEKTEQSNKKVTFHSKHDEPNKNKIIRSGETQKFFPETTSIPQLLDDDKLSQVSNFYPSNIADIFDNEDDLIYETSQLNMTPSYFTPKQNKNNLNENLTQIPTQKKGSPIINPNKTTNTQNEKLNPHVSKDDNNKFSQISNFYPSNIADIFQNMDESTYCDSSQINMTPSCFTSEANKYNLEENSAQIPSQKKGNPILEFNKNTNYQKEKLNSHLPNRTYFNSFRQPLDNNNNKISQVSNFYPSNIADIFNNVDDSTYSENSQINMAPSYSNLEANKNNLNENLPQIPTQKIGNPIFILNKTTNSQKEKHSDMPKSILFNSFRQPLDNNNKISQVSNFYPSNIVDIFNNVDDSTYCESSQINMAPSYSNLDANRNDLNENLTQIPTQKKGNPIMKFSKTPAVEKAILSSHVSKRNCLSSIKQPLVDNNKLSQLSNFYPSNIAYIFKNMDDSTYCENSQTNMSSSYSHIEANKNNLDKKLTQKKYSLTQPKKTPAYQKEILTSHVSKRNFLSSLKQSVKFKPENRFKQFTITPRKKLDHNEIKRPNFDEYYGNIFEPDILIQEDENNVPGICNKLFHTCKSLEPDISIREDDHKVPDICNKLIHTTKLNNFDQAFSVKENTPNEKTAENNIHKLPVDDSDEESEENEYAKIPKLADSFRDYVMKSVQKFKEETNSVNDEMGFAEFLLAPLNESYSDTSTSEDEGSIIVIPKTKPIITQEQKTQEVPLPNIILSSLNVTSSFDVDQIFDNSLYKDCSFAKLNQSMIDTDGLPSTSFNITQELDPNSSLHYNNIDKFIDQINKDSNQQDQFEDHNNLSFLSPVNLTVLPESEAANENNFTFPPLLEGLSHDLSLQKNFVSEELKNMECSENSTDNSDSEAKSDLRIDSKIKMMAQWYHPQDSFCNQGESDIPSYITSRQPIKKMRLDSNFTVTKSPNLNRIEESKSQKSDVFEKQQPLNKLLSNYNTQYANHISLSNKQMRNNDSNTSKQSVILERTTYNGRKHTVSQKNQEMMYHPSLKQFQKDNDKGIKRKIFRHPYFRY